MISSSSRSIWPLLAIASAGAIFFLPFLGAVHLFDWDEINFAESAREMLVTGNFTKVQIEYQPFWEKPPLFFWLQAAAMSIFGVNEFAARFPNALAGIATLLTFFVIGKRLHGQSFGMFWALSMLGSFLPHLYFKSGIIDPVFNYFIFLGIWFASLAVNEKRQPAKNVALSGFFIGLATLTKGPVALLIMLLVAAVCWISVRFRKLVSFSHIMLFALTFACSAGIWFAIDIYENGIGFVGKFIQYQLDLFLHPVAGHSQPIYYHFVIVLLGCFPISVMALPSLVRTREPSPGLTFRMWMLILFWVVLILFSAVKTKIVHYSSLTYFPLSYLAAHTIHGYLKRKAGLPRWQSLLLLGLGVLLSFLLAAAPWIARHKELIIPYINDPFARDCLNSSVQWNGLEPLIGVAYGLLVITSVVFLLQSKTGRGVYLLFFSTALCLLIYLKAVVPKIEQYSQGPPIEFYESLRGKDVYVTTYGFKSYAPYFYFRKPPGNGPESSDQNWLLQGPIRKPAYFVVKSTASENFSKNPAVRLLYRKGGFAFFVREP